MPESALTTPNDGIICTGASVTITGTGGGTYLWSTGATTAAITVTPAGTTTYTVTVTSVTDNTFSIEKAADGTVTRDCTRPNTKGGCPASLSW